jgi:hypothetical protein
VVMQRPCRRFFIGLFDAVTVGSHRGVHLQLPASEARWYVSTAVMCRLVCCCCLSRIMSP